jgi:hypothetical protein
VEGTDDAARKYYREIVSPQMKLETPATIEASSIRQLLAYFGYPNLAGRDLHQLHSDALMASSTDDDILASRFFAPKITDVRDKPVPEPEGGFGWRKLTRLKARPGSAAEANGLEFVFILQNLFEASVAGDPFNPEKNISKFNQAIATRKVGSGPYTADKLPAYFLMYGRLVKVDQEGRPIKVDGLFQDDGSLVTSLLATFDENDRIPETNSAPKAYFVPDSCIQCHGGQGRRVKLNYLDTDHWFDRVTPAYGLEDAKFSEEDFTSLSQSPHGVLYDGGKDSTTSKFRAAFAVIRRINEEIKAQNSDVAGPNNFQLNAVAKWLDLHRPDASDSKHVPPYERGFGAPTWDPANTNDRTLLYYLNRYCYRCHSSVRYNVFDRNAVKGLAATGRIEERVLDIGAPDRWMPQDRIFPGLVINNGEEEATGDLKQFLQLLQQIQ